MANKKEVKKAKMTKQEILDKCVETVEYSIPFAVGVGAIWGLDVAVYVAAFAAFIIAGLKIAKLFVKD